MFLLIFFLHSIHLLLSVCRPVSTGHTSPFFLSLSPPSSPAMVNNTHRCEERERVERRKKGEGVEESRRSEGIITIFYFFILIDLFVLFFSFISCFFSPSFYFFIFFSFPLSCQMRPLSPRRCSSRLFSLLLLHLLSLLFISSFLLPSSGEVLTLASSSQCPLSSSRSRQTAPYSRFTRLGVVHPQRR